MDKKTSFDIRLIVQISIGLCICICIIWSGSTIGSAIKFAANQNSNALSSIHSQISTVSSKLQDQSVETDFMSFYEACSYLNIDEESLQELLDSGTLDGTYISTTSGETIFIRKLLYKKVEALCIQ